MSLKLVRKSQHAHVLICRSCSEAFSSPGGSGAQTVAQQLKMYLESQLLSQPGETFQVRIVESSCLDVCPVGAVSVRLVGAEGTGEKTMTWTCHPVDDADDLLRQLKAFLQAKS